VFSSSLSELEKDWARLKGAPDPNERRDAETDR
jgi:hypothetical protein